MNRHQQEAKKYLSQAFGLNQRIESKLDQSNGDIFGYAEEPEQGWLQNGGCHYKNHRPGE